MGYGLDRDKGITVKRLEDDHDLQETGLSMFHATMVTCQSTNDLKIIENNRGKGHYLVANVVIQPVPQANVPNTGQNVPADTLAPSGTSC